ncbi:hypothetical protein LTR91_006460 [Friedmanniomyces endolithicus]|uniref:Rhodopsin domain-containing protein n=2 Tax=Dothideomycetidae TaxID=451867 RepID=A0A4U0UKD9_9PEZI|nr:hypothetical protein LTS09_012927 [Friedmanniomyces endolithicus]KAK0345337.1 hypothetical protein LTR94_011299 [Friedmanniomyces endolithicus]KAK0786234.1 hypothetical protein LTR59_010794 [Friedmanniomyces endolithicus]KAK0817596.1 hypothetical protein LTR38_001675 [Friedmanniomyces endolithicus]KAK0842794.1 hypothetical protein LTS02_016340 [Friedmanniomyces endolithicus]
MTANSNEKLPVDEPLARIAEQQLIISIWVLAAIALIFVLARIGTRLYVFRRIHMDDGFAILALVVLIANGAVMTAMAPSMYELLAVSVGREIPTPAVMMRVSFYLKCQLASTILFWSCLWSVKASFLAFFRQLSEGLLWPRRAWWAVTIVTLMSFLGSIVTYPVSCTSFVFGQCQAPENISRSLISLRFSTAVDVITDVCIIALPIAIVARVHISPPQKVALIGVLSLGLIIIGFAIARIVVTDAQGTHPEISWLALWSAIESSVAVLVCCLASFKALFTGQRHGSSRQPYYTHSSSRGRGVSSKHGSELHQEHGEVRMAGPSSRSRSIPLNEVKGGESRVTREQWMDDSSSEMEIFGEIPKERRLP